jgi:hypothetical protein
MRQTEPLTSDLCFKFPKLRLKLRGVEMLSVCGHRGTSPLATMSTRATLKELSAMPSAHRIRIGTVSAESCRDRKKNHSCFGPKGSSSVQFHAFTGGIERRFTSNRKTSGLA